MAFQNRNKFCYFKENGINEIDYKDVKLLRRFVNDQGKIPPLLKIARLESMNNHAFNRFKNIGDSQ